MYLASRDDKEEGRYSSAFRFKRLRGRQSVQHDRQALHGSRRPALYKWHQAPANTARLAGSCQAAAKRKVGSCTLLTGSASVWGREHVDAGVPMVIPLLPVNTATSAYEEFHAWDTWPCPPDTMAQSHTLRAGRGPVRTHEGLQLLQTCTKVEAKAAKTEVCQNQPVRTPSLPLKSQARTQINNPPTKLTWHSASNSPNHTPSLKALQQATPSSSPTEALPF